MKQFDIFVDSSANIPDAIREERGINVISYSYILDGKEHLCYEKDTPFIRTAKSYYDSLRAGADIKTSLVGAEAFISAVTPSLEAGRDVLILTIASGISGTYQQALNAKTELEKQFPECRIAVADSANASLGQGLLALKVADLRDMGESLEACENWLKLNTYKMNSFLTVDDLKYLKRSGRISATLAIAGTLLNIKPVLTADGGTNAKIVFFARERGRKKSISALAQAFLDNAVNPENQTVAIAHADCEEDAQALAEIIRGYGAKDVIVEYYDLCTGAHVGPGTVALFFMGKDRRGESAAAAAEKVVHAKPAHSFHR